MNFSDLNWILKSKIFLHRDEQLQAVHVILEFTPISNHFQSPKNVIRAKDLRLALIDVAILGFLTKPTPFCTQNAQLLVSLAAKLLYSQEQAIPSDKEPEERTPEPTQEDLDKDFEVFYCEDPKDSLAPTYRHLATAQVSTSQEATKIPKAMVLEEKTPDLLALLTVHTEGNSPMVLVIPRPPTPTPVQAATTEAIEKKRKKGKAAKAPKKEKFLNLCNNPPPKSLEP